MIDMLWALTPYGDAVFTQRQARELCHVVERGTHLYLWFIGD
ncbi:hypothetical protein [Amycolatopsis sp. NPDC004625]